jgi:predicted DsbA family dithiol-disulfide isomerase
VIKVKYFSDVLCVWAYIAQIRVDELQRNFADDIEVEQHFITLFGNTQKRIGEGWKEKGGFDGFNRHVLEVGREYEHCRIHPDVWVGCQPSSSANAHLFLKAVDIHLKQSDMPSSQQQQVFNDLVWRVRCAFFEEARDISHFSVLFELANEFSITREMIQPLLDNGLALAEVFAEHDLKEKFKLEGSPTFVFNNGRQKLYGNVGYKIIEANILELLSDNSEHATWC